MLLRLKNLPLARFIAGILLSTPTGTQAQDTLISPDNPAINYYGRFDFSDPEAPRFNWSGTTIEFQVTGSATVGMEFTDGAGYYDIEVDGEPQPEPVFADSWSSRRYTLVDGLSPDAHGIRIIRRNEPYWAIATFSGIYLSTGAKLLPLAKPERKMEFCGDSWTAGYFVEACTDQQAKTNTNKSWARFTSKAFRAQDIILAESGIGLVKSLGGKTPLPGKYLGTFDTLGGTSTPMWDFSSWIPDIVSIFLGINDHSAGATDREFADGIHSFVTTIRSRYPDVPILFIAQKWSKEEAAREAVAAETTTLGHQGIHFLEISIQCTGCSAHPTVDENREIAKLVIAKIKEITGWDTPTNISDTPALPVVRATPAKPIVVRGSNSSVVWIHTHQETRYAPLIIADVKGRTVLQLQPDPSGVCTWNTAHAVNGSYVIGNLTAGWITIAVQR